MAIAVTCPHCGAALQIKDDFAGKRGSCPRCQQPISVPHQAAAAGQAPSSPVAARHAGLASAPAKATEAPPAAVNMPGSKASASSLSTNQLNAQELASRVMAGFTGSIQRVQTSLLYRLGILLVTAVMILLPLIYVSLIAFVAWAVYWHMVNNVGIVGAVRGRGALFAILIYLAPLVIGVILIVFMVKPLFAAPARRGRTRSLTRDSDPLLFQFVAKICETVRAPMPSRIDIDHQINASASFRRGFLSFLGSDLVLTIGMPLAGGLSLQQFAGVLAHEFGHFSQGAGMRLTYIVRTISNWFLRVVYERDTWDEWLANSTDGMDLRISWILYLAQACVWLTRRVLWVLMYVGHVVAGFMLRQMEFDADRYEARLAGSETFAATVRQLHLLNLAQERAQSDFGFFFREGRLADNLPKLVLANSRQLPPQAHQFVDKVIGESKTGLFDTHPGDQDRIASAAAERAAGVFRSDLPATVLFRDFDAAARNVTWDFYCEVFESPVQQSSLVPVDELLKRTDEEQVVADARNRFLLGTFQILRPLRLSTTMLSSPTDPGGVQDQLVAAREQMGQLASSYRQAFARYDELDSQLIEALQIAAIRRGGVRPQMTNRPAPYHTVDDALREAGQARDTLGRLDRELVPFEEAAGRRLLAALTLIMDRRIVQRLEQGDVLQAQARRLLPLAGLVSTHLGSILELRNRNAVLSGLLAHIEGNESHQPLIEEVLDSMKRCHQQLVDLRQVFVHEAYPFDHAKGEISMAQFLLEMTPPSDDLGGIAGGADRLLSNLASVYSRAVGRLASIAEQVEENLGLSPLPMPEENESAVKVS